VRNISVVREGLLAARHGASALHDATEGGVLGALFELAEASGIGLEVWPEAVPILPETVAICRFFAADPLRLISSGTMVIATPRGQELADLLAREGVRATVVARATPADAGRWLVHRDGRREELLPPERDELWRILEAQG
jgi:hydrogenase maturation factor